MIETPKPKKDEPKVLICRHCFGVVTNDFGKLWGHLKIVHDIGDLRRSTVKKYFWSECEIPKFKDPAKAKMRRAAFAKINKIKLDEQRKIVCEKRRIADEKRRIAEGKRRAEIAEYRKSWMGENYIPFEKHFHCGEIITGGPSARIIYTAMGGSNKKMIVRISA